MFNYVTFFCAPLHNAPNIYFTSALSILLHDVITLTEVKSCDIICFFVFLQNNTIKPVLSSHSKRRPKNGLQDRLSLNAGQSFVAAPPLGAFCNTFTCIKLPFGSKTFALSIFEWSLKTGFTVLKI